MTSRSRIGASRRFRTAPLLQLLMLASGAPASAQEVANQSPLSRPNFIVITADDLGFGDLSSYGSETINTPNLDRMASEGQRWTDFYAIAPVCSPSRGALLTGRLPVKTGLYGRQIPVFFPNEEGGMPEGETTIAEVLSAAGYRTAIFGKWHLGDRPHAWPTRHGFDEWVGIPYSNDMDWADGPAMDELIRWTALGRTDDVQQLIAERRKRYLDPRREYWNVPVISSRRQGADFTDQLLERSPDQSRLTQNSTDRAIDFIRRAQRAGEPFFLYLPFAMPHTPIFPSAKHAGSSLGGRYGDVVQEIDANVGRLLVLLDSLRIANNTLVVFTSDNGPWLLMGAHGGSAGPLNNGKGTTFEGGMRVPTVFWWPERIRGGDRASIGTAMDLFRTLAELAGVPNSELEPLDLDSVNLAPVLFGREGVSARTVVPYYRQGELQAYRRGRYKLRLVSEGAYSMPPERVVHDPPLLFDLHADPGETADVAPQHPGLTAELLAEARRFEDSVTAAKPLMDQRIGRAMLRPAAGDE